MGYADKKLLAFLSDVDSGKRSIQDMGTYIESASKQTTLFSRGLTTLKTIGKTAFATFANMAIMWAATAVIQGVITVIDDAIHRSEKLIEKGEEAKQAISDARDSYSKKKEKTETVSERYAELAPGVDPITHKNISLTNETYSEYLSLCDEIATIYPELITGYDAQGTAILNLGTNADETTAKLQELLDKEKEAASVVASENFKATAKGTWEEYQQSKSEANKYKTEADYNQSIINSANNIPEKIKEAVDKLYPIVNPDGSIKVDLSGNPVYPEGYTGQGFVKVLLSEDEYNLSIINDIKTALSQQGYTVDENNQQIQNEAGELEEVYNLIISNANDLIQRSELYNSLSLISEGYLGSVADAEELLKQNLADQETANNEAISKINSIKTDAIDAIGVKQIFSSLPETLQGKIEDVVNSMDIDEMVENGSLSQQEFENFPQYIIDNIVTPLSRAYNDEKGQTIINAMTALDDKLKSSDLTQSEYRLKTKEQLDKLKDFYLEKFGEETGTTLYENFLKNSDFTKLNDMNNELIANIDNATADDITKIHNLTSEQLKVVYDRWQDQSQSGSIMDYVNEVIAEQEKAQQLIDSSTPITFSSLFKDADGNDTDFSKSIDTFQSDISSIQESLDSLKEGEEVDLTDLVQEFPELAGQTDHLQESLNNLKLDKLNEFSAQWKEAISGLTDENEIARANEFFQNLVNSIDLSDADFSNVRQNLLNTILPNTKDTWQVSSVQETISKLLSKYGDNDNALEVMVKLAFDESAATWDEAQWISNIEAGLPKIDTREDSKQVTKLQNQLEDLQSEASKFQESLDMKDTRGVQKVANDYEDLISNSKDQIVNLREQNALLQQQQRELDPTSAAYRNIQSQIDSNNASIRSAIKSQLEWNAAIKELPPENMTQLNAYTDAQQSANPSDNYNTIVAGKDGADKLWEQGWVGKDDFTTYAQLLSKNGDSLYDAVSNYEANASRLKKYLTEDTSGLYNFLDDAVAKSNELDKGWVKLGDDGKYTFDIDNLKEFSDEMGMNTELAGHFFMALRDMGMEVDLSMIGDNFAEQFDQVEYGSNNAAQQVQNLINEMETLASADVDITGSVDASAKALKQLSEQGVDVSGMLEQLNELGNMNGFHINDDFTVTFTTLQNAYNKIAEYKDLSVNVDANVNGEEQLNALAEELAGMDQETLIEIGFTASDGKTITAQDIKEQIGTVEIPVEYQKPSDTTNENVIDVKTSEVDDSTVQEYDAGEKTIDTKTSEVDDATVQNFAPGQKIVPVKTSEVNNATVQNYDAGEKTIDIKTSEVDDATVQNYVPEQKIVPVKTGILDTTSLNTPLSPLIQRVVVQRVGEALGTAHTQGTAVMDKWTDHCHSIGAYAGGTSHDWALPHNENALVNETGKPESIVRNGRWFMIPGGAHMQSLKKGDIIFNAAQTEELIKYGKVISGGGQGRVALADGTAYNMMPAHAINQSVTGGTGNNFTRRPSSSGSSSSSSSSSSRTTSNTSSTSSTASRTLETFQKWLEKLVDWIEVRIKRITASIDLYTARSENAIGYRNQNYQLGRAQDRYTALLQAQREGEQRYLQQADKVTEQAIRNRLLNGSNDTQRRARAETLIRRIQNGTIDINEYNENEREFITAYMEWYDNAMELRQAVEETIANQRDLEQQRFENIADEYDNILDHIEHRANMINEYMEQSASAGYVGSGAYYQLLNADAKERQRRLRAEQAALVAQLQQSMNSGIIQQGDSRWYEMQSQINAVSEELASVNGEIIDINNNIRELEWEQFDRGQESISRLADEFNFMIDLMSDEQLFDDHGQVTAEGMATFGLHAGNYNVYMEQANEYAREYERIQRDLAKDPYNTTLLERREELLDLQRESVSAAEDEKQAMADLVQQGINAELDSLKELINRYEEALDSKKDLYDYQRDIADQTSEISNLQKQINAYSMDTSEEGRVRLQQAQDALKEAQENLKQTEYERYISDQKELLDSLYTEYEDVLNARLDNIDELVSTVIASTNENAASISATLEEQAENVGYTMTDAMTRIWDVNASTAAIVSEFSDRFSQAATSIQQTIDGILEGVNRLSTASDLNAISTLTNVLDTNAGGANPQVTSANTSSTSGSSGTGSSSSGSSSSSNTSSSGNNSTAANGPVSGISGTLKQGAKNSNVGELQKALNALGYKDQYGVKLVVDKWFGPRTQGALKKFQKAMKVKVTGQLDSATKSAFKKKGYANGTDYVKEDEWAWTQEEGREIVVRPDGSMLIPLRRGSSVINNPMTEKLLSLANDYDAIKHMTEEFDKTVSTQRADFATDIERKLLTAQIISNNSPKTPQNVAIECTFHLPNIYEPKDFMNYLMDTPNAQRAMQDYILGEAFGKSSIATRRHRF